MKLVKPTDPPSMAILVDTLIYGMRRFQILNAHPTMPRIDTVFVCAEDQGAIRFGVVYGTPHPGPTPSVLPSGSRAIAHLHILPVLSLITDRAIEEVPNA